MRAAIVTPEWYADEHPGGIATYSRLLAQTLLDAGVNVTIFAATLAGRVPATLPGGLSVIPVRGALSEPDLLLDELDRNWHEQQKAAGPYDFLEAPDFGGMAAILPLHKGVKVTPLITRLHTPLTLILARNPSQRFYSDDPRICELERLQVHRSRIITSPTSWLTEQCAQLWNIDLSSTHVFPNITDQSCLASATETVDRHSSKKRYRVLFLGRLEYRKGCLDLAEALSTLFGRGVALEATFSGKDTKYEGMSMSARVLAAIPAPFHRWVCFSGALDRSDLVARLDEADLVVLPSHYENQPYACFEAMSRARPVLATTGSGFDEIINHGVNGYLTPPRSPASLANAILAIMIDPTRPRVAKCGRDYVASLGARSRASTLRLYRLCVDTCGGPSGPTRP